MDGKSCFRLRRLEKHRLWTIGVTRTKNRCEANHFSLELAHASRGAKAWRTHPIREKMLMVPHISRFVIGEVLASLTKAPSSPRRAVPRVKCQLLTCISCFTRRERQTREMTPPLPQTTRNACTQGSSPRWSTVLNVVKCATVSLAATCFMTSAAKCRFAFALATLDMVGIWKWQAGSTYHTGTRPIVERSLVGSRQSLRTTKNTNQIIT